MIEYLACTLLARELPAALGSGRAEHAQARSARNLCGGDADGTARTVDQNRLTRDGPPFIEQRTPRGDVGDADAGTFRKRHMARKMMNLVDGAHGTLRVGAVRPA